MRGGRAAKVKGTSFEREIVNLLRASDIPAKRTWGSDGRSIGLAKDVDVVFGKNNGWHGQCKRKAKLPSYIKIPEGCNIVLLREDNGVPLVVMRLSNFITMEKRNEATA